MQTDTINIGKITALIKGQSNWRQAAEAVIQYLTDEGQCFSSGEVARWLRICEPSLVFSVPTLGEHIRDLFYSQQMPNYPDDGWGNSVYPSQVPRTTQGLGRTPAGVEVLVYCPDPQDGFAHGFDVDIPKPGGQPTHYPQPNVPQGGVQTPGQAPLARPKAATVKITGAHAKPIVSLKATVQKDGRLQVPRSAFEAFVHFTGQPMKGGEPVYVNIATDCVTITLGDPGNGAKPYDLTRDRGRVSFPAPSGRSAFAPGDTYMVDISQDGLSITLT